MHIPGISSESVPNPPNPNVAPTRIPIQRQRTVSLENTGKVAFTGGASATAAHRLYKVLKTESKQVREAMFLGEEQLMANKTPISVIIGRLRREGCSEDIILLACESTGRLENADDWRIMNDKLVLKSSIQAEAWNQGESSLPPASQAPAASQVQNETSLLLPSEEAESSISQTEELTEDAVLTPRAQSLLNNSGPAGFSSISTSSNRFSQGIGVPVPKSATAFSHKTPFFLGFPELLGLVAYALMGGTIAWLVAYFIKNSNQKNVDYVIINQTESNKKKKLFNLELDKGNISEFVELLKILNDFKSNKISKKTLEQSLKNSFNLTNIEVVLLLKEFSLLEKKRGGLD